MTEQLYFDDPLTLEFTAQVAESRSLDEGRFGLVLPRTYFYPTSGGQEHDTGTIGPARVLVVYKEGETIVHVSDRELPPGEYPARIDRERRLRAMQHHTAQHILSASFLEVADIDSISANINGETPSTIDLDVQDVSEGNLQRAEELANGIFLENRPVKSYHLDQVEIKKLPVRKPPKVSGKVRVVEIEGFDYTPCGGTHCPTTGMVGMLKIVRIERVKKKVRIHFVAGYQALQVFQQMQTVAQGAALLLDSSLDEVVDGVEKLQAQLKTAQREIGRISKIVLDIEAAELSAAAEKVGDFRLVTQLFENRSPGDLRSLANALREEPGLVALLATYDGVKLSMVASCAADTGLNAAEILDKHLAPIGGRGGGDAGIAQGGGNANQSALEVLFKITKNYLAT